MICAAAVLITAAGSGRADITVIDFESLGDLVVVDDQFVALGADFNGDATVLSKSTGSLNWTLFPPFSGDKVIYDTYGGPGFIRVDAVGAEWTMVGAYVTGNANIIMTAYDSGGNALGSEQTGGANYVGVGTPNMFLSVSASDIAYAVFGDSGNTFTIDDFSFTPVPVPGAVLLGVLGLGAAGLKLRRHA
jgi:hypothetical protein